MQFSGMAGHSSSPLTLHGLILVLVAFGLLGLSTELALLEHYEDVTMTFVRPGI